MSGLLYIAWRYVVFHPLKTLILVGSITVILYLPIGLGVLVDQSSQRLTQRGEDTPLVVGAAGSPLELVLNTLYFSTASPKPARYEEVESVAESGFADAIPLYVRFRSRSQPIVGTTLDYFDFRDLRLSSGRKMAMLGECVVGSRAARVLGVGVGDHVISSPESVFDLAGVYPLKMPVVGVLDFADGPDDDAVFVDLKTAWIIQGLGHGHQDLAKPAAAAAVLLRDKEKIVANASVVQYNEITADNAESFHFHGDLGGYPITAVIAVPRDRKSSSLLQGRYQSDEEAVQITRPRVVMAELLDTILTMRTYVVAGAGVLGIATLATASLVFLLSLRLRRREIETLSKIGGSRSAVGAVMASEVVFVLTTAIVLAALLTALTSRFGSLAVRALVMAVGE